MAVTAHLHLWMVAFQHVNMQGLALLVDFSVFLSSLSVNLRPHSILHGIMITSKSNGLDLKRLRKTYVVFKILQRSNPNNSIHGMFQIQF